MIAIYKYVSPVYVAIDEYLLGKKQVSGCGMSSMEAVAGRLQHV